MAQECLAKAREAHAPLAAHQQRRLQFLLELLDRGGQGWLGETHFLRDGPQAAMRFDEDQGLEGRQAH